MLLGMSKQLVYAFPGFYNKETLYSNNLKTKSNSKRSCCVVWLWTWKKKGKENSFGLVNKRFGLLSVWGKKKCISVRVKKALLNRDPVRLGFES